LATSQNQIRRWPSSSARRALFLFQGPHAYISPSWISDRTWGPTWNYAVIRIEADVRFLPDRADEVLARLVRKMERGRERAWSIRTWASVIESCERGSSRSKRTFARSGRDSSSGGTSVPRCSGKFSRTPAMTS
jgi:predicted FMN-binding regulatory protein PaiB